MAGARNRAALPAGSHLRHLSQRRERVRGAAQDHAAVVQDIRFDEVAVGGEAGIVPVFNVCAGHFVTSLVSALTGAAGFDLAAVGQQFMAHMTVFRDPHARIRMTGAHFCFLGTCGLAQEGDGDKGCVDI